MKRGMKRAFGAILFAGAFLVVACLPGDLRPEPGHVYLRVEGADTAQQGFVTEDGWTIHFDKLLVRMGHSLLAGTDCEVYGEARYLRLVDLVVPEDQLLGEMHGLKACNVQFFVTNYGTTYTGSGVTRDDWAILWDREDLKVNDHRGTIVYVRGSAGRGSVTKHFSWRFRRDYSFTECGDPLDGTVNTSLQLKGGENLRPLITFHPDELFRDGVEIDAKIRFEPLAETDVDADGEITLEEVSAIPSPVVELTPEELHDAGAPDGGYIVDDESKISGWPRFMAQWLLKRAFRLDGRACRNKPGASELFEQQSPFEF